MLGLKKKTVFIAMLFLAIVNVSVRAELPLPVSYWRFDEGSGSTAYDSIGNNDGTLVSGSIWTTGIIDGALNFNGTSDYLNVSDDDTLDFDAGDSFTITAWIKTDGDANALPIVYKRNIITGLGGYFLEGYELKLHYSHPSFIIEDQSNNYSSVIGATVVNDGEWHFVTAVRNVNEDTISIYVDGELDADPVTDTTVGSLSNSLDLLIGRKSTCLSSPSFFYFEDLMDEVIIFDRALSEPEIEAIYQAGLAGQGISSGTIYDHFDNGVLDPNWTVTFENISEWTYLESGTILNVTDMTLIDYNYISETGTRVNIGQPFLTTGDFYVECAFSWDSGGSDSAMQCFGIELLDGDARVIGCEYYDSWFYHTGAKRVNIGDQTYISGQNTLPLSGSAVIGLSRVGDTVIGTWNGEEIFSAVYADQVDTVSLDFRRSTYSISTFGSFSVDYIYAEAEGKIPATTYHVDVNGGSDSYDGLSRETAFATIQKGVDEANNGEIVLVWPGIYYEDVIFDGRNIELKSADDPAVIVSPNAPALTFYKQEEPNCLISNFVIRGSWSAVLAVASSPTLRNLTIVDNDFGIESYSGADPLITHCIFYNNTSGDLYNVMGESNVEYSWLQSEVPEPISYWKFDEGSGSTAYDFTGDNDGAIYDASWTSGVSGEALNIHSTGYVDCGQDTSFDITGPITLSAWVKTTGTELAGLLGKWDASVMDGDTYQRAYSFLLNKGPGKVTFYLSNDGVTNSAYVQSSTTVNNGLWHMVTGVYDGNSIKIYIDGDCENIQAYSGGILSAPDENFYIGNVEEGVLSHPVNGLIDEVVIYDEALSESEIKSIYQAGLLGQGIDSVGPFFAAPYDDDYHLKSQRGRYWAEHRLWVLDDVTSPCVDAGDPAIVPSGEPMPNGGRINIGAYGGTAYASMSEWPLSGDLNRDGTVNLQDYAIMTEQWMDSLDWY